MQRIRSGVGVALGCLAGLLPVFLHGDESKPGAASAGAVSDGTIQIARFDSGRPEKWTINVGHWETENGVLVVRELAEDKHAAASRWMIPSQDISVKLKVKFAGAKGVHVGFDPAAGELKKKGHLYSLIVTDKTATIKRHKDKADEKSKEVTLATADFETPADGWIPIELTSIGNKVSVNLGKGTKLEAIDETFGVSKPGIVFRCMGGDAHLDDVEVRVLKGSTVPATVAKTPKKKTP